MGYSLISYHPKEKRFYSYKGEVNGVSFIPQDDFSYYVPSDLKFVIKIKKGWLDESEGMGEIIDTKGKMIEILPRPSSKHGKFRVNGIVSGDSASFKFIVEPFDNSRSYFLWYDVVSGKFSSAGNIAK